MNRSITPLAIVLLIVSVFSAPIFLAYWAYHKKPALFFSLKPTNKGILVQPPILLESLPVAIPNDSKWKLILWSSTAQCDSACQQALHQLKQIQKACGKDQHKVSDPVLILGHSGPCCILMADPYGYIMMRYKPPFDFMDIFQDLQHLLKVARIAQGS